MIFREDELFLVDEKFKSTVHPIGGVLQRIALLSLVFVATLGSCMGGGGYGATPYCSSTSNGYQAIACATDATHIEIHQGETVHLRVSLPSSH